QAFVGSPFAKCEELMHRVPPLRELRILGASGKNSVRADVNRAAAIALAEYSAVRGEENGQRVRRQQHVGGYRSRNFVEHLRLNAGIVEVDCLDQLMQCDMGVATAHTTERRNGEANESRDRAAAKACKADVEPDNLRFVAADRAQKTYGVG